MPDHPKSPSGVRLSRRTLLAAGAALNLPPAAVSASFAPQWPTAAQGVVEAPTLSAESAIRMVESGEASRWWPHRVDLTPAQWIWLPGDRTLPLTFALFRRELKLAAAPRRATALICADSRYRLSVNGKRLQFGPAACDPREADVDVADLAPYLVQGENVIGVEVLFYGHGDGTWPGGRPGLLFHLQAELADGSRQRLISDEAWLTAIDRAHPAGHYKRWYLRALQEEFDSRLHPHGWDTPAFRPDGAWMKPQVFKCAASKPASCSSTWHWSADTVDQIDSAVSSLRLRQIPAATDFLVKPRALAHSGRVKWHRPPEDWFDFRIPGSFEVDRNPVAVAAGESAWELPATAAREGVQVTFEFPEHLVGWPGFTIDAPEGAVVELMPHGAHDPEKTRWLDTQFFAWTRFVCREGVNRLETFDYESLRWLQLHVRNASRPVRISDVGVRRRSYAWPNKPSVQCSDAAVQRVIDASLNTVVNAALETIVDTNGRERQQYSGDVGHQLHVVRAAFGETKICRRYLRTYSHGLTKDGYFLDCWPAYDRTVRIAQRQLDAAAWGPLLDHGVGFVFDCWNHYMETGEREALVEPYPRLKRSVQYLRSLRRSDGLLPVTNLGVPNVWMDNHYARQEHKQCSFNLYAAAMLSHALAPMADLFGEAGPAGEYRQFGKELLAAAVKRFWSERDRTFVINLPWLKQEKQPRLCDRSLAMAILFGLCPGGDTAAAVKAMVECPQNMMFSYPANQVWRLRALAKAGRADAALADVRNRWATLPSVVENNCMQEHFQVSKDTRSEWCHCPMGPLIFVFDGLCGIEPMEAGFRACRIRPQLGDLDRLNVTHWTPLGPIEFRAERTGAGAHRLRLAIPKGCRATLVEPSGRAAALKDGETSEHVLRQA